MLTGEDVLTRRSTAGGIIVWGSSTISAWAKLQPVIALSSAEAEYYGMVSGVQRALAIQSLLEEFNIPTKVIVRTDSMAAKQSVEKVGLLHVKHMAMRMLFLKDLQRAGVIDREDCGLDESGGHVYEAVERTGLQEVQKQNPRDLLGRRRERGRRFERERG